MTWITISDIWVKIIDIKTIMAQELNLDECDNAMNDKHLSIKKLIWDKNTMTFVDYDTFERPTKDQLPINYAFRYGDIF